MKKTIYLLFGASIILTIATSGIQSDNGKAGKTKSPGETSCVSCHGDFAENSGGGIVSLSGIPTAGYVPGTTYNLKVTVKQSGMALFSFGLEALKTGNVNAGKPIITDAVRTQIKYSTGSVAGRANVVHMLDGGASQDSSVFSFDWQAPSADSGIVKFYFVGLACDADGGTGGDNVYVDSTAFSAATGVSIAENTVAGNSFSVYPNPVKDNMTVNFSTNENSVVKFTLTDISGRLVSTFLTKNYSNGNHTEKFSLPVGVTKGAYFLTIDIKGEKLIQKLNVL